ncbi:RNA pyrophosphohydrolase [Polycladidibacter hongkongensis]|uniref:RNA pyrophosphohydrolase n=1 Tax=Polycladidibacter hongkongensis TaxID=1647556 RepID=UPI00082C05F1|nr:RNA pyrophosphohydrolase [Pseudovibrio hongkongensis]
MIDLSLYRPCVGIMLINNSGKVWIGKRFGDKTPVDDAFAWQMPQGGIDEGEDAQAAALRELFEETSVRSVEILGQNSGWFSYDFPPEVQFNSKRGRYKGQKQRWFAMRFTGADSEINILTPPDGHAQEFSEWRWVDADEVPKLIVPFKREVYQQVIAAFSQHTA